MAGDCLRDDSLQSRISFFVWLARQEYREKIFIAGNHDNSFEKRSANEVPEGIYLCDSGTEIEYQEILVDTCTTSGVRRIQKTKRKLKVWGSPWTKTFEGMNPKCKAFAVDTEEELLEKWCLIPTDIDILITHSPPFGILDRVDFSEGDYSAESVGSQTLRNAVQQRPSIKIHVFGHIHEEGGRMDHEHFEGGSIRTYVNASHVNERYKPVNKPVRVIL